MRLTAVLSIYGALVGAIGIAVVKAPPAAAAPTIDIRAQTKLSLESVQLRGNGLTEIRGQLIDRLTGDGLGGQSVTIQMAGKAGRATTMPDGKFRTLLEIPRGPQQLDLAFRGGVLLEGAALTMVTNPAHIPVTLAILVDARQPWDPPQLTVQATADEELEQRAQELTVELLIGVPTDENLRPLQAITTGEPFVLTRKAAGGLGPHRIRAVYGGDGRLQAASAEVTVDLVAQTITTMRLNTTRLAHEDDLVVSGTVKDDDGQPVPRVAVTLVSGDRRLAQGATAADGSYRFSVEAEIIGSGRQYAIQVQSDPGSPSLNPSRSTPVIVTIAAPQPVPVSYTIAAFLATALAAGGFFVARSKPWLRFRRRTPPSEVPANVGGGEAPHVGGLVSNRPSMISTLRRANDDGFSGVVRDTVRSRPVPEAVVRLLLGQVEREVRTNDAGSFELEGLAAGEWRAEVAAPGHLTERFGVSIPHRGELRGVRIDLVPVRERVFQLYRRAAEPLLPDGRSWGIWSPRQIVDHVKTKHQSPALADLTDFVEEVYFSARVAPETVLPAAADRVDRAIRERARP